MHDITKKAPLGNMTGNRQIAIAATDEISAIRLTDINTKTVVFKQNRDFGVIEATDIRFGAPLEDGAYLHEVSCRLVSTQGKHNALFNRMKNKRWVVVVIDNNNIAWLLGSLDEPLHFIWEHIGEEKPSGQHCYELIFSRQSSEPVYCAGSNYKIVHDLEEDSQAYCER